MELHILPCDPEVDTQTANNITKMLEEFLVNEDFQYIYNWKKNHELTDHYYHERFNNNYDFMSLYEGALHLVSCVTLYTKEHQDSLKPSHRYYYIYPNSAYWLANNLFKRRDSFIEKLCTLRQTIEFFEKHCDINEDRAIRDGLSKRIGEGIKMLVKIDYCAA